MGDTAATKTTFVNVSDTADTVRDGIIDTILAHGDVYTDTSAVVVTDSLNILKDNLFRITVTAGENIFANAIVYIPVDSDSVVYLADADDTSKINIAGIAKFAIAQGNVGYVYAFGIMDSASWNFQAGRVLYLSETAGKISQSLPANSPAAIIRLGRAIAPKKILFMVGGTIIIQ